MSILIDKDSRVLVQGITGKLGRAETQRMTANGTNVVAGVTPGKGGTKVCGVPVYDSVAEAVRRHAPNIAASFVPPSACLDAAREVFACRIPLLQIAAEHVPLHDSVRLLAEARDSGTDILGPNSLGVATPGAAFLGGMGARDASRLFMPGPVGVVSKSGGLGVEMCWALTRQGIGQSSFVALGGDRVCGLGYGHVLRLFERDPDTTAIVMLGEAGAPFELEAAEQLRSGAVTKPVIGVISGAAIERFPGTKFGHGGAIVDRNGTNATSKRTALSDAGVRIVATMLDVCEEVKRVMMAADQVRAHPLKTSAVAAFDKELG